MPTHQTEDALVVNFVQATPGRIGLCACPGRNEPDAARRSLERDLDSISETGVHLLVSLIEAHEFALLGLNQKDFAEALNHRNLAWIHLPVRDLDIPEARINTRWTEVAEAIHARLTAGEGIVVHCRSGLGRSGMLAARLLVERGEAPGAAIARVRTVRPGAIETDPQLNWVGAAV